MLTDYFMHVHVPKTGGQFIRKLIMETQEIRVLVHKSHLSLDELCRRAMRMGRLSNKKLPSFCFVRNPWEWYVSRFFYRHRLQKKRLSFDYPKPTIPGFRAHMDLLDKANRSNLKSTCKSQNVVYRFVSLSEYHNYMVGNGTDYICRFENFSSELERLLPILAPTVFDRRRIKQKAGVPINTSGHLHYTKYYTRRLIDMVAKWDAEYITKFAYAYDYDYKDSACPQPEENSVAAKKAKKPKKEDPALVIKKELVSALKELSSANKELIAHVEKLTKLNEQVLKKYNW